ncbi:MAG: SDR family NAD(P)-dependent oxidoreductase [Tannerellaceae bacterium]|jgi:short-subunit dehydrogenase|nr:SDR family NAD(P)-dependent oxidoreductase [Tannerellaceae bacterium]
MKHAIVIGATSGIGLEVAKKLLADGWRLGVAGRREKELKDLQALCPERISIRVLDVTHEEAPQLLLELIAQTGGMDLFFLSSGIGYRNRELLPDRELRTVETNAVGFTRMVTTAFRYFKKQNNGHLAVISSIAGTKGMGSAPAYSATKRFQNTYMDALAQLAHAGRLNIHFTDIRPGFVATAILDDGHKYPLLMKPERVAAHIVRALKRRKRVVIIDKRYAVIVFLWRLAPQWLWERINL